MSDLRQLTWTKPGAISLINVDYTDAIYTWLRNPYVLGINPTTPTGLEFDGDAYYFTSDYVAPLNGLYTNFAGKAGVKINNSWVAVKLTGNENIWNQEENTRFYPGDSGTVDLAGIIKYSRAFEGLTLISSSLSPLTESNQIVATNTATSIIFTTRINGIFHVRNDKSTSVSLQVNGGSYFTPSPGTNSVVLSANSSETFYTFNGIITTIL